MGYNGGYSEKVTGEKNNRWCRERRIFVVYLYLGYRKRGEYKGRYKQW